MYHIPRVLKSLAHSRCTHGIHSYSGPPRQLGRAEAREVRTRATCALQLLLVLPTAHETVTNRCTLRGGAEQRQLAQARATAILAVAVPPRLAARVSLLARAALAVGRIRLLTIAAVSKVRLVLAAPDDLATIALLEIRAN